jgi:glyoxylase-like metal-dependent hydrolase (beta-lactamase superfamily II)
LADDTVGEASVVDTSYNTDEIVKIVKAANYRLRYIINTHGHSDHTSGNEELKRALGGKLVAHRLSRVKFDVAVDDGDIIQVGKIKIKVIHTPGHTPDSICLLIDDKTLLTGDTLFVGECGRTDFPGGNSRDMYHSLFNKLLKLDDAVLVYPGHDYGPKPSSTIGEERKSNYTLQPRSLAEFVDFMHAIAL